MNKLSIKIKIFDREYPMTVDPADEERLRQAGKLVNERLKYYKDQFGIDDKQDLLAMVAFDAMVNKLKIEGRSESTDEGLLDRLKNLNNTISQSL